MVESLSNIPTSRIVQQKNAAGRQEGVALITALLVVALAAVAATAMLTANNIAIRRSTNIFQRETASWYLTGLEQWAGQILRRDRQNNQVDNLKEKWAKPLPQLPIQGGYLKGRLIDLQGRFNLNSLGTKNNKPQKIAFQRLVHIVLTKNEIKKREVNLLNLANAITDWIDADKKKTLPGGAEDIYYRGQKPPYRTANHLMSSPSELLLVKGVTSRLYRALRPYITTLPNKSYALNVNTAPWPVLAAEMGMQPDQAKQCVKYRAQRPFENVHEIQSACKTSSDNPARPTSKVQSNFFLAVGHAEVGGSRVTLYSLLQRQNTGLTRVYAHSYDVF